MLPNAAPALQTPYPPAPWTLGGWGLATLSLVDLAAAAPFVPAGAALVAVAPGKTVGGTVFLAYETGPLTYREFNVVAGLIRIGTRFAFLLPQLYVDSAAALAGGREIWGLPKERATFEIERGDDSTSVDVIAASGPAWRIRCQARRRSARIPAWLPLPLPAVGVRPEAFSFFTAALRCAPAPVKAQIVLPDDGAFAALGLDRPLIAFRCDPFRLTVPPPRDVARHSARR